jgi:hypothetical protein
MPTTQIIHAAVGQLRAQPANVHAHSKKQLGLIARSIRRLGFTDRAFANRDRTPGA